MKWIFFILLSILSGSISGQSFTNIELEKFVNIYFLEKEIPRIDDVGIAKIFEKYNITADNYHQNKAAKDKKESLEITKELEALDIQIKEQKKVALAHICKANNLAIKTYNLIKIKYTNNHSFHRSLKPYFDQYIKTKIQ